MTYLVEDLVPPDGRALADAVASALKPWTDDPDARRAVLKAVSGELAKCRAPALVFGLVQAAAE